MHEPDDIKARLIEAAGEEFAAHGYEGATIRSIIRRAGANIAAVNYHFGDKQNLYTETVIEAHRRGMPESIRDTTPDLDPTDRLRLVIRRFLEDVLVLDRPDDWAATLMMREMARPSVAVDALVERVIRPRYEGITGIIRRLAPHLEGPALIATVFSVVGQCMHYRFCRAMSQRLAGEAAFARLDLDFLTDHITDFTLAALGVARRQPIPVPAGEKGFPS